MIIIILSLLQQGTTQTLLSHRPSKVRQEHTYIHTYVHKKNL